MSIKSTIEMLKSVIIGNEITKKMNGEETKINNCEAFPTGYTTEQDYEGYYIWKQNKVKIMLALNHPFVFLKDAEAICHVMYPGFK